MGFFQCANDGVARQSDLEGVVGQRPGVTQQRFGEADIAVPVRRVAPETFLQLCDAPWLVGHAAERQAQFANALAVRFQAAATETRAKA